MNTSAATDRPPARLASSSIMIAVSYLILGAILLWSRLAGLDTGFCCDEIRTVTDYVREGPRAILTGPYLPNNHELFSMLGWATSSVAGESVVLLRAWSVIPFLLGVGLVTAWLHVRMSPLSGIVFLFLATWSPLLLDISRMARGYGLAFLAMGVLVVAALEAERTGSTAALCVFAVGGLVGSLTLPHFSIVLAATAIVLATRADLRVRVAVGTGVAFALLLAWYGPHLDEFASSRLAEYGARIETAWLVTAPIDQTLVPAVLFLDDTFVRPRLALVPLVVAFVVLAAASPFLRSRRSAAVLCSSVVATMVAFWFSDTYVVPRFISFLLVPLFMLVATGVASTLAALGRKMNPASPIAAIVVGSVMLAATPYLWDVPRTPRDATSEVADAIREQVPSTWPVFTYVPYPRDLEFHLGRQVHDALSPTGASAVCGTELAFVFVRQDYLLPDAEVPCIRRAGTRHLRFEQFARGGHIDAWFIPTTST